MLAGYYLDSEPLDNMEINFGCTLARPIKSLALARWVTWWAFALNLVGICPKLGELMKSLNSQCHFLLLFHSIDAHVHTGSFIHSCIYSSYLFIYSLSIYTFINTRHIHIYSSHCSCPHTPIFMFSNPHIPTHTYTPTYSSTTHVYTCTCLGITGT